MENQSARRRVAFGWLARDGRERTGLAASCHSWGDGCEELESQAGTAFFAPVVFAPGLGPVQYQRNLAAGSNGKQHQAGRARLNGQWQAGCDGRQRPSSVELLDLES